MSWNLKERLHRLTEKERGVMIYPAGQRNRMAFIYPNSYHVGMSNLGLHILYKLINERGDTACERFFLPDRHDEREYIKTNTPLLSLETQRPLFDFPLLGVTMSFEMDYFNLLKILQLGKVRPLAAERGETEPLIIIGGPCATFNPEPLSEIADAFVIGEGEETMQRILDVYYAQKNAEHTKSEILRALADIAGVYVPGYYEHHYNTDGTIAAITMQDGVPAKVRRQWVKELDAYEAHTVILTEETEFKNLYLVETARGCGRHCRFCMAGYCFRRPRNRSSQSLKKTIADARGYNKKIGLMGAAISDYPQINELCAYINACGLSMSVASFRADSVTGELVKALAESGLKTLTLAPEAGSRKLRAVINKGITDAHLYQAIDYGVQAGIMNYRLYIMVGLPYEDDSDIEEIINMAKNVKTHMLERKCKGILTLSINPFISKPFTPFQWLPMENVKVVENRLKRIKNELKKEKNIDVIIESPKEAYIQGVLARGDRRIARILYEAHKNGGIKAFKQAMQAAGLSMDFYLYRQRAEDEIFPWDCIDVGVERTYLHRELELAAKQQETPRCLDGCKRCGVCK